MRFFILFILLIFAGSVFAQDTLRTRDRDNFQGKEQVKKQERKQDKFIDLDGDGINDAVMERFQNMIRKQNRVNEGTGDGEMIQNRNQNRIRMKDGALGPGDGGPKQTQNGTKGKGKK